MLPRFAGHSSNQASSIGGIELKLLPRFDRFTKPRTSPETQALLEIIETDLLGISNLPDQKFDDFIDGYHNGFSGQ